MMHPQQPMQPMQQQQQQPQGQPQGQPPGQPQAQSQQQLPSSQQQQPQQVLARDTYVVFTCGGDREEVVVRTLVGEYVEKGANHGRKVYQKIPDKEKAGQTDFVDVLLYYWDSRDGPNFEGWWFGNRLGGTQVWSHCKDSGLLPPGAGWKIPWDGPVRQTLVVMNKEVQQRAEAEEKLKVLSQEVSKMGSEATRCLNEARSTGGDSASVEGLAEGEKILKPQAGTVEELIKKVADAQAKAVGDPLKAFMQLSNQLRNMQTAIGNELAKITNMRQKVEQDAKNRESEEKDAKLLEELMPEAFEKTNAAEDMVEKCVITAEMISACGDDPDVVRQALEETDRAAKNAQATIGEARIFLNAKLAGTRRFAERIKEKAAVDLGKLQQQLQEAQNKLNPLKNARTEYEQRRQAQRLVTEVEEKVVLAEVDVDRAEELVSMLGTDAPTKDGLNQAQHALQTAEEHINQAMRVYENKKQAATGVPLEELLKLGPRGDAARNRIQNLRAMLKEAGERVTTDGYLCEASEKVQAVVDALSKLEDIESKFQDDEVYSLEEVLATVKSSESAVVAAQSSMSLARMFIQMKLLEVRRFSSGPGSDAASRFSEFQTQIEIANKRLVELRNNIARRRRASLVKEAETQVARAETFVEKVKEAASIFADDAKLMDLTPEEMHEASEKATSAERDANDAIAEVRKFVSARQMEAKGKDACVEVNGDLIKFQTRISAAANEISLQRKLMSSVEQRLSVKRLVDEAENKIKSVEDKVTTATDAVAALPDIFTDLSTMPDPTAKDPDTAVKDAESAVQEATIALRTMRHTLDSQSRSQGFAKDAMAKLDPRLRKAQDRLDAGAASLKERADKMLVRGLLQEVQIKIADCEASLQKAISIEPQTEGDSELATKALQDFEKAIQATQHLASSSKTMISMKKLSVKRLSESTRTATSEALTKMAGTVDEVAKKATEMRGRFMEMKKKASVKSKVPKKS